MLAVLGYWELHIRLFRVPEFLIPAPSRVVQAMFEEWPALQRNTGATLIESLGGFVLGNGIAISLPFLFSALKIAATSCVIGAIVSEWIGADTGLGYLITIATFEFRTGLLYSAMVVGSLMALAQFGAVVLAERLIVRWKPPTTSTT